MSSKKEFSISKDELKKYKGPGGFVEIPEGITRIGNGAFQDCETVTGVVIPEGVEIIGNDAFNGCKNLTSVVIPDSVKWIFMRAFKGCDKLADAGGFFIDHSILLHYSGPGGDIVIPEGVTKIGSTVFEGCENITSVVIPEGVTEIGVSAFRSCRNLTSIAIPDSVTNIDPDAFVQTNYLSRFSYLKKVKLPVHLASQAAKIFCCTDDFRIDIADLTVLSPTLRQYAALCFAEDGGLTTDPRYESHAKYLKTNAGKFLEQAAGNTAVLALFCREGWIKAKDIQKLVDAVQQTGDPERIAMVLDYQTNSLTSNQKRNAVKEKEKQDDTVLNRAIARSTQEGIAGLNFAVTGEILTFANRNELKTFIESCGGKLVASVSSKTDYLIFNDITLFSWEKQDKNSEKIRKAQELGIEIITEFQLYEKAGKQYVPPQHNDWL